MTRRTAKTFERGEALNERELEVLRWLDDTEFQTPRHVGGRDGSHHSNTLSALAGRGLVERKKYHAIQCPNGTTQRSTWHAETSTWVETTAEPYAGVSMQGSLPIPQNAGRQRCCPRCPRSPIPPHPQEEQNAVKRVAINNCTDCPFAWDGTDMDDEWRCTAVDLGDQFKQIRNIRRQFERRVPPPRWCPLRRADHLVTLRVK